jgi:hypothetical protein
LIHHPLIIAPIGARRQGLLTERLRCTGVAMVHCMSLRQSGRSRSFSAAPDAAGRSGVIEMSWRDHLKIHPAADLFPLMPPEELQALADDIKANGIRVPPESYIDEDGKYWLLDGRNRLDAMECRQAQPGPAQGDLL